MDIEDTKKMKTKKARLPPQRGQIKARIFGALVRKVKKVVAKASILVPRRKRKELLSLEWKETEDTKKMKRKKARLPPQRGQIKARIFSCLGEEGEEGGGQSVNSGAQRKERRSF